MAVCNRKPTVLFHLILKPPLNLILYKSRQPNKEICHFGGAAIPPVCSSILHVSFSSPISTKLVLSRIK